MKEVAFINRENELMTLSKICFEADHRKGKFVFISGEDGMGKTSLVHAFYDKSGDGIQYMEYIAEEGVRSPYESFVKLLKPYPNQDMVSKALSYLGVGADGGAPTKKEILFNEMGTTFMNMTRNNVLVVFINRIHLLDKDSIDLFIHVARECAGSKLILIGTYAPDELMTEEGERPLVEMLAELMMEPFFFNLTLEGLSEKHVSELVCSVVGRRDIPSALAKYVLEESDGNPMYALQVLDTLINDKTINLDDKDWPVKFKTDNIKIPQSIKELINARLAKLDDRMMKVIKHAAVLGSSFRYGDLEAFTGIPKSELLDILYKLSEERLIYQDINADDYYRFDHMRIQKVVEESMGDDLEAMHRMAGELIEDMHSARLEEMVFKLAYHFSIAKDWKRAAQYGLATAP
jgi:predicted ATPase